MSRYAPGDYIKAEFRNDSTGESEWMWIKVEYCDEREQLVFGWLDSLPLLDYGSELKPGSQLAVAFGNIRDHKKASDFSQR